MLASEKPETIEELSKEISAKILEILKRKSTGTLSLSTNYHCKGGGYICGNYYLCHPKSDHSCAHWFSCTEWYVETNYPNIGGI
jgi:hypothetical protein